MARYAKEITRRRLIQVSSVAAVTSLAGCPTSTSDRSPDDTPPETTTPLSSPRTTTPQATPDPTQSGIAPTAALPRPDGKHWFASDVAVSGDTVLVSDALETDSSGYTGGTVYVFVRDGDEWRHETELVSTDRNREDVFGSAVAITGNTALVSAPGHDAPESNDKGAAYVFERSGDTWSQQAKLAAYEDEGFWFGDSVDLSDSGRFALVGAERYRSSNSLTGAAFLFERTNTGWRQRETFTPGDGAQSSSSLFGQAVSLTDNAALIGAPGENYPNPEGSAYLFVRTGDTWRQAASIGPGEGKTRDWFGRSVALTNDVALVGAPNHDGSSGKDEGVAYVFDGPDRWRRRAKLAADDGDEEDKFGTDVALSDDIALVSAPFFDNRPESWVGSVHVFERTNGIWRQRTRLALDPDGYTNFGGRIAVSESTVIVSGTDAAYVFEVPTSPT